MPAFMRRLVGSRWISGVTSWIQQPLLAAILFVGLIGLWLYPPVHFRAMIDARLYAVMNWSMVVDGILFWCLVLDPRPVPAARVSVPVRAALAAGVMYPQIAFGLAITFIIRDLYPFYALCGRAFSSFPPHLDQALGGIIVWVAGSMMSVLAFVYVLYLYGTGRSSRSNELCGAMADRAWENVEGLRRRADPSADVNGSVFSPLSSEVADIFVPWQTYESPRGKDPPIGYG
jgi:putative membrane protein